MDVNGRRDSSSLLGGHAGTAPTVGMTRRANSGFPFKHCTFILAPHRFAELNH